MIGDYDAEQKELIKKELVVPFNEGDKLKHEDDPTFWEVKEIDGSTVELLGMFKPEIGRYEEVSLDALKSEMHVGRVKRVIES